MPLVVLLGGARSGKSALAVRLARQGPTHGTFVIATAEPRDEEMRARLARHREERPAGWSVVEEPLALADALSGIDEEACVIVDCLTVWVANLLEDGRDDGHIEVVANRAAAIAAARPGSTIAVTNEVGSGIVPANPGTRRYRDTLGRVNACWAGRAERAMLVVAGLGVALHQPEPLPEAP